MRPGDVSRLFAIDEAADRLLIEAGHGEIAEQGRPDLHGFERFLAAHDLFVSEDRESETATGYAAAVDLGDLYWLAQIAVHPSHGRKGFGTALLMAVIERARWAFHRAIALSTFRDVAFNAPFYAKHGFLEVEPYRLEEASPLVAARYEAEMPPGADPASRALMVKWL